MMLADLIAVHDPAFHKFFTEKFLASLSQDKLDQVLLTSKWDVRMKGETEKFAFGFIRPVRAPGASKT